MLVRELIELNSLIGDITVTIRDGNGKEKIKAFHIGAGAGIPPIYHDKNDVYKEIEINAWDTGKEYYKLLMNKLPKQILDLQVFEYNIVTSYRRFVASTQHSLQHIYIAVRQGEKDKTPDIEGKEQLKGQMNIEDFI